MAGQPSRFREADAARLLSAARKLGYPYPRIESYPGGKLVLLTEPAPTPPTVNTPDDDKPNPWDELES